MVPRRKKEHFSYFYPFPKLTDIIRHLLYGDSTSSSAGGSVAAGVARVPDVGVVCADRGATGGGGDHTTDSKTCSTGAAGCSRPAGAL